MLVPFYNLIVVVIVFFIKLLIFKLTFRYLPGYEDLFKHLFSLHQHAHVPNVVIVENLDHYCNLANSNVPNKNHDDEMHAALICASLIDAMSVCAKHCRKPAVLIASFHRNDVKLNPLIDLFFSNIMWLVESDSDNGVAVTNAVVLPQQSSRQQLVFKPRNWDGTIILHKILKLINVEEIPQAPQKKIHGQL
jgi:hypothetical protein